MLASDWAPDDKAVLGSWLEQGYPDQTVLAIWPIGPMMATRPERVHTRVERRELLAGSLLTR